MDELHLTAKTHAKLRLPLKGTHNTYLLLSNRLVEHGWAEIHQVGAIPVRSIPTPQSRPFLVLILHLFFVSYNFRSVHALSAPFSLPCVSA
ncbi:hypothetical protein KCU98_g217, partial [Aureobasidium melanogenum]